MPKLERGRGYHCSTSTLNSWYKHFLLALVLQFTHGWLSLQQASSGSGQDDAKPHAHLPQERLGYRFMVKCNHLEFKLTTERNGERGNVMMQHICIVIVYTLYLKNLASIKNLTNLSSEHIDEFLNLAMTDTRSDGHNAIVQCLVALKFGDFFCKLTNSPN